MEIKCPNCGQLLYDGDNFCPECGHKIETISKNELDTNDLSNTSNEKKDSNATSALVCGIVGLFFFGVILGIFAIVDANKSKKNNNGVFSGKARAGFILGIIDIVGAFLTMALLHR